MSFAKVQSFLILRRIGSGRASLLFKEYARGLPYQGAGKSTSWCSDTNSFWMLLSGNAEVAFQSRKTIAAAANLLTSATAADTSTADVVAITASATSTLTTFATFAQPSARQTRNSARQKRKAHP
jgi:hypothetical protein